MILLVATVFDLIIINVIVVATQFNNNRDLSDFVMFDMYCDWPIDF